MFLGSSLQDLNALTLNEAREKVKSFCLVSYTSKVKNELTNYTVDEHFH